MLPQLWLLQQHGKGGKAAASGYWVEVVNGPRYVLPVTGTDERMDDVMDE